MAKKMTLPLSKEDRLLLKAGDSLLLSGVIYTARDAAHKRLFSAINNGEQLPLDLNNATIYYAGPCPAREGEVIGSCGPTTSCRCDSYTPLLIQNGLACMIGKGGRSQEVVQSMIAHGSVYLCAIGGAGALYAACVQSSEIAAYADLGAEALRKLTVKDFPVIVGIDSKGQDAFFKQENSL